MTNQIPTGSPTAKLNSGKLNTPYKFTSSDLLLGFSDADKNSLQIVLVTAENGEFKDIYYDYQNVDELEKYSKELGHYLSKCEIEYLREQETENE